MYQLGCDLIKDDNNERTQYEKGNKVHAIHINKHRVILLYMSRQAVGVIMDIPKNNTHKV